MPGEVRKKGINELYSPPLSPFPPRIHPPLKNGNRFTLMLLSWCASRKFHASSIWKDTCLAIAAATRGRAGHQFMYVAAIISQPCEKWPLPKFPKFTRAFKGEDGGGKGYDDKGNKNTFGERVVEGDKRGQEEGEEGLCSSVLLLYRGGEKTNHKDT